MNDLLTLGRELLAAQPCSRLFGLTLEELAPGMARLRIDLGERHKQQHGLVHGGVVCCAAESALHLAGLSVLGCDTDLMEIKLDHLRPAAGDYLIAHAATVHIARRQAVCRCDVMVCNARGEWLCATASGTVVLLPSLAWGRSSEASPLAAVRAPDAHVDPLDGLGIAEPA